MCAIHVAPFISPIRSFYFTEDVFTLSNQALEFVITTPLTLHPSFSQDLRLQKTKL